MRGKKTVGALVMLVMVMLAIAGVSGCSGSSGKLPDDVTGVSTLKPPALPSPAADDYPEELRDWDTEWLTLSNGETYTDPGWHVECGFEMQASKPAPWCRYAGGTPEEYAKLHHLVIRFMWVANESTFVNLDFYLGDLDQAMTTVKGLNHSVLRPDLVPALPGKLRDMRILFAPERPVKLQFGNDPGMTPPGFTLLKSGMTLAA